MSIDVPNYLHPVLSSLSVHPWVPFIWLVTWRCHIVVVIGVVEQLWEVIVGGGGDEAEVVDDGGS